MSGASVSGDVSGSSGHLGFLLTPHIFRLLYLQQPVRMKAEQDKIDEQRRLYASEHCARI